MNTSRAALPSRVAADSAGDAAEPAASMCGRLVDHALSHQASRLSNGAALRLSAISADSILSSQLPSHWLGHSRRLRTIASTWPTIARWQQTHGPSSRELVARPERQHADRFPLAATRHVATELAPHCCSAVVTPLKLT